MENRNLYEVNFDEGNDVVFCVANNKAEALRFAGKKDDEYETLSIHFLCVIDEIINLKPEQQ